MNAQVEPRAGTRGSGSRPLRARVRRWIRTAGKVCALPTLLACAESPLAPDSEDGDRAEQASLELVDGIPLYGTDREGRDGRGYERPPGSELY